MRGDLHPHSCPLHKERLILTTSGTQAVCPLTTCTYYERTDRVLRVRVKKVRR